jgi:hypothetical protein
MKEIFHVSEEDNKLARKIEDTLTSLSKDAGILFVSVRVLPHSPQESFFDLLVGCTRSMDERTIDSLLTLTVGGLLNGRHVLTSVRRGVLGAASKSS